jgi:hypothetical protein
MITNDKMSEFTQTNDSAASAKKSFYLQSSLLVSQSQYIKQLE